MGGSENRNNNELIYDVKKYIENITNHKVFKFSRDTVLHEILLQHSV